MEIPRTIFTHWEPPYPESMERIIEEVRKNNPEFDYRIFSDQMCRSFINDNFDKSVVEAYDTLIPDAYKSDLWRYCVLYIFGGIYLDIKFRPVNGFTFNSMVNKEYFVQDRPEHFHDRYGVYSGLIICKAKSEIMLDCIAKVVKNVKERVYGHNPLYPTGPGVLSAFVPKDTLFDLRFMSDSIEYKGSKILETYAEYRLDQQLFGTAHYDPL